MSVENTLNERQKTHGSFEENSQISQSIKDLLRTNKHDSLYAYQQEALDMIAHKMSRIVTGNGYFIDSWRDIAGYAQLVVNLLQECPHATDVEQFTFNPTQQD